MKPNSKEKKNQNLLWKIHHWAGLYTGIIIGILCITGAIAVFIPEIDLFIQKQYYSVSSSPYTTPRIDSALAQAKKDYPKMSGLLIDMPDKPGQTATFSFAIKGKGKADSKFHFLFVDAGQDKIIGSRDRQNSLANYLRQMHVRLYEGFWGRQLVGLAGIAFIVLTITGMLIYSSFMKKQPYPKIRKKNTRILMADWHKILGISALAFNFVIACTGAWLGLLPKLMQWFGVKEPSHFEARAIMDKKEDAKTTVRWDQVFKTVKKEFPELKPGYMRASEDGSASIEVHGSIEGLIYERNINALVISKTSYQPLFKFDIRQASFSDKLYAVQEALHFGDFGGLGLKILYAMLGLTSAFLSISGFVVYLYRTDKKKKRTLSPLKTTFIYTVLILLVLIVIAVISMLIGYRQAAFVAAIIVNGTLAGFIMYAIVRAILKKLKTKSSIAPI
ncbi:putative iron-regulated membrane protein [Pedobacter africanus]|uniref:Iron-regulated membrane protein n=1 Tax=Pedobacter africanus TaxID=151894 RepID=A0ACC6KU88_9SPHI|nr:PepSY-associated TM helix domain-containing protein [Pedobacter africanus]MDR6782747.1 putative iron-regulated membrane protein [Pedobacter africanus]